VLAMDPSATTVMSSSPVTTSSTERMRRPSARRVIDQPRESWTAGSTAASRSRERSRRSACRSRTRSERSTTRCCFSAMRDSASERTDGTRDRRSEARAASRSSERSTAAWVRRATRWARSARSKRAASQMSPARRRMPSQRASAESRYAETRFTRSPAQAGDRLGVEHGQLVARPAAPDDDDHIEVEAGQGAHRSGDHWHRGVALDAGVGEGDGEAVAAPDEFVVEVVPGGRVEAGGHSHPERERREGETAVGVEEARHRQPAHHVVAGLGDLTERVARVEAGHLQAEAAALGPEVEVAEDADLHPVPELEAVALEDGPETPLRRGEQLDVEHRLALVGLLDEGEVRVGAPVGEPVDLTAHPHPVGEAATELGVDGLGQLGDPVGVVRRVVELGVTEVERRLAHHVDSISPDRAQRARRARQAPSWRTLPLGGVSESSSVSSVKSSPSTGRPRSRRRSSIWRSGRSSWRRRVPARSSNDFVTVSS